MKAKITNKQIVSDNDYYGNINQGKSDGYKTNKYEASITNKQITSDNDYYGGVKNNEEEAMSYDNIYNAIMNDTKELMYNNRNPTNTSVKISNGMDDISLTSVRQDNCQQNTRFNHPTINSTIPSKEFINTTQKPLKCENDRLDTELLQTINQIISEGREQVRHN